MIITTEPTFTLWTPEPDDTRGESLIAYHDGSHTYALNGEPCVSVTTVLKVIDKGQFLADWIVKQTISAMLDVSWPELPRNVEHALALMAARQLRPDDLKNLGGKRGTAAHKALEAVSKGGELPRLATIQDTHRGYVRGLAGWYVDTAPEFLYSEVRVAFAPLLYAGTFDYIRRCRGDADGCPDDCGGTGLVLGDAKTSKAIWDEAHIQAAAYKRAWEYMGGQPICSTELLLLKPDGTATTESGVGTFEMFEHALALHRDVTALPKLRQRERARRQRLLAPRARR